MENQTVNCKIVKRSIGRFGTVPILRNILSALTDLVKLTKEDRVRAGIFLGYKENDENIVFETFERSDESVDEYVERRR